MLLYTVYTRAIVTLHRILSLITYADVCITVFYFLRSLTQGNRFLHGSLQRVMQLSHICRSFVAIIIFRPPNFSFLRTRIRRSIRDNTRSATSARRSRRVRSTSRFSPRFSLPPCYLPGERTYNEVSRGCARARYKPSRSPAL